MAPQHPLPAALDSGGRVLSLTAYTRRLALRPKEVFFFFRLKVYERGGILIFKVYERLDKAVIWSCKRAKNSRQKEYFPFLYMGKPEILVAAIFTGVLLH